MRKITAAERVELARAAFRPTADEYINNIFEDFIPLSGDRACSDDQSVIGGIASFHGVPVTVIGHRKGKTLEDNVKYRFGMPNPDGYRKAQRLMDQAAKFGRPIITFVDTPGAYPGKEAEERGQGQAIAESIRQMSRLNVPTISIIIGEGGSGGALAFAVSDRLIMLENSIYSILSPEGFASILWHDAEKWREAAEAMKLTAGDLKELGVCDLVLPEPDFSDPDSRSKIFRTVDKAIRIELAPLLKKRPGDIVRSRYTRFRNMGKEFVK